MLGYLFDPLEKDDKIHCLLHHNSYVLHEFVITLQKPNIASFTSPYTK